MDWPSLKVRANEARIIITAETNSAINNAPSRMIGIDSIGIEIATSDPFRRNIGVSMARRENIIAIKFRRPAANDMVATYRYLAIRTLLRLVARVMTVSQVEFSRSPAVESIAGCMAPVASI